MDQQDDTTTDPAAKPKRSRKPMIFFAAVVLCGALAAAIVFWLDRNEESTDDAFIDGHAVVIDAQDAGAIVRLQAKDNQFVHKGDVLVVIDQRTYQAALDQAKADLASAQAQLVASQAQLARDKLIFPAQLAAARANLAAAQAQAARADSDAARQHRVSKAATTAETIEHTDQGAHQAVAQVTQAEAQVRQADVVDQNLAIAAAGVARLQADVAAKKAKLDDAQIAFDHTSVVAPEDGWITKKNIEVGSFVQPGTELFAIVTPDIFVTGNFKESQLTRMRPGDKVAIEVDAYPDMKLEGHVDSVQLGTGSRFTAFPAENATGNFVKIVQRVPVKILIDKGLDAGRPLSLGLSVVPTVTVR